MKKKLLIGFILVFCSIFTGCSSNNSIETVYRVLDSNNETDYYVLKLTRDDAAYLTVKGKTGKTEQKINQEFAHCYTFPFHYSPTGYSYKKYKPYPNNDYKYTSYIYELSNSNNKVLDIVKVKETDIVDVGANADDIMSSHYDKLFKNKLNVGSSKFLSAKVNGLTCYEEDDSNISISLNLTLTNICDEPVFGSYAIKVISFYEKLVFDRINVNLSPGESLDVEVQSDIPIYLSDEDRLIIQVDGIPEGEYSNISTLDIPATIMNE